MERITGGRRARYAGTRLGPPSPEAQRPAGELAAALAEMEALGLAPLLEDGGVAGNGALRLRPLPSGTSVASTPVGGFVHRLAAAVPPVRGLRPLPSGTSVASTPVGGFVTSASARRPGDPAIAEVVTWEPDSFALRYRSDEGREPTSDVALHALAIAAGAGATLHGHALETEEDAARLGLPIASSETEFGTREDLAAMAALLARAPYPTHRAWIRRGHGFLVAAATMDEARALVRALAASR